MLVPFVLAVAVSGCLFEDAPPTPPGPNAACKTARVLGIANVKGRTATCITLSNGQRDVTSTDFDENGVATEKRCLLLAAYDEKEKKAYWMSGPDFDIELSGTGPEEGPEVRRSQSTMEHTVRTGDFPGMRVRARDQSETLWSGTLHVCTVDLAAGTVSVEIAP
jgi:hypothetical protein